jgi:hypothetical protein
MRFAEDGPRQRLFRGQNCLCPWHLAKHAYPVVHRMDWLELSIIPLKKEAEEKKKSEKVFSIYFS